MDRVNGTDWVDIGGGRRGFRSQNAAAGVSGTEVTDKILNDLQEEICAVIEKSGFELDPENQQQLWEALLSISAPGFSNRAAWLPVISVTTTAPPNNAVLGDAYVIPAGASGAWAGNQQKLAEWTGSTWRIVATKDGHGVSLPDGRVYERVDGVYVEKLALDVQSGKWNYAVAGGTANALTATLTPVPAALSAGLSICINPSVAPSAEATLNLNGLGARPILGPDGAAIRNGDMASGALAHLTYSADYEGWILTTSARLASQIVGCKAWGTTVTSLPGPNIETTVLFAETVYTSGSEFNLATSVYTVNVPGIYTVACNFYFENVEYPSHIFVLVNGAMVAETAANTRGRVLAVTTSVPCAVGDKISIRVKHGYPGTMTLSPAIVATKFPFALSIVLGGTI